MAVSSGSNARLTDRYSACIRTSVACVPVGLICESHTGVLEQKRIRGLVRQ